MCSRREFLWPPLRTPISEFLGSEFLWLPLSTPISVTEVSVSDQNGLNIVPTWPAGGRKRGRALLEQRLRSAGMSSFRRRQCDADELSDD